MFCASAIKATDPDTGNYYSTRTMACIGRDVLEMEMEMVRLRAC